MKIEVFIFLKGGVRSMIQKIFMIGILMLGLSTGTAFAREKIDYPMHQENLLKNGITQKDLERMKAPAIDEQTVEYSMDYQAIDKISHDILGLYFSVQTAYYFHNREGRFLTGYEYYIPPVPMSDSQIKIEMDKAIWDEPDYSLSDHFMDDDFKEVKLYLNQQISAFDKTTYKLKYVNPHFDGYDLTFVQCLNNCYTNNYITVKVQNQKIAYYGGIIKRIPVPLGYDDIFTDENIRLAKKEAIEKGMYPKWVAMNKKIRSDMLEETKIRWEANNTLNADDLNYFKRFMFQEPIRKSEQPVEFVIDNSGNPYILVTTYYVTDRGKYQFIEDYFYKINTQQK